MPSSERTRVRAERATPVTLTRTFLGGILLAASLAINSPLRAQPKEADVPRAHDQRLVVERFAAAPDIVHPIGLDFDSKGRLLVIESHTHFPPPGYKGPKHDRVRML